MANCISTGGVKNLKKVLGLSVIFKLFKFPAPLAFTRCGIGLESMQTGILKEAKSLKWCVGIDRCLVFMMYDNFVSMHDAPFTMTKKQ